jgi:3-hydroxyacyl-[acyl-carrier-protein] dehydratase
MAQPLERPIDQILPHRYPFLTLDRVAEFVPGERITGFKEFSANDELLQGRCPEAGLVPAAILFELVTQLGAVLVMHRPQMEGKIAMILQIPQARMHHLVQAGERLRVEAVVVRMRENFGELRGTIYRGPTLVGEGTMRFGIAPESSLNTIGGTLSRGELTEGT